MDDVTNGLIDFEDEEVEETEFSTDDSQDHEDDESELLAQAIADGVVDDPEQEEEQEEEQETEEVTEDFKTAENAKNAERRRQNEERLMNKLRSESPEFILAQQLVAKFGKAPEVLLSELLEAQMKEEAQRQGIPVEVLQREAATKQELADLRQRADMADFMVWNNQIEADKTAIKAEFPMLDDADLEAAKGYITGTLVNLDVPLKQAVLALHGEKIIKGLKSAERNEALAQVSGRKAKSITPPKSGKSDSGDKTLSAEEVFAANVLGVSEKDYLKYKI